MANEYRVSSFAIEVLRDIVAPVQYTATIAEGVGVAPTQFLARAGNIAEGVGLAPIDTPVMKYGITSTDNTKFQYQVPTVDLRWVRTTAEGVGIAPTQAQLYRAGRIISDVIRVHQAETPNLKYAWTAADTVALKSAAAPALAVLLAQGLGLNQAQTIIRALVMLQGLGIAPSASQSAKYTQTLVAGLGVASSLAKFLGGTLAEGVGVHDALSRKFTAYPILAEGVGINPTQTPYLVMRVTVTSGIGIDDEQLLNSIYNGTLDEGIEITAGYLSAGSGVGLGDSSFTAWAMNTRTGAVSEYTNYAFNSFARMGNKYLGASSTGLYELLGDSDAGADIIADIKSGFAQWAGTKLTMFKAAYLGMRASGDFVLKITTGDGKSYNYALSARDMRTTKVNIGKGLRARYFAFELISTGQDFDLDTIEFIPLVAERRV